MSGIPAVRRLERGLRTLAEPGSDARLVAVGARSVAFGLETGHMPADRVSMLYWMSALVTGASCSIKLIIAATSSIPWSCAGLINALMRDAAPRQ